MSKMDKTSSTIAITPPSTTTTTAASTMSVATSGPQNHRAATEEDQQEFWLSCIQEWYPDRYTKTYLMPPLRFNRMNNSIAEVAEGVRVLVLQSDPRKPNQQQTSKKERRQKAARGRHQQPELKVPMWNKNTGSRVVFPIVPEGHIKDDAAMEKVCRSLSALGEVQKEPMMVVSDLKFQHYLKGATSPVEIAALPRATATVALLLSVTTTATTLPRVTAARVLHATATASRVLCATAIAARRLCATAARLLPATATATAARRFRDSATATRLLRHSATATRLLRHSATATRLRRDSATATRLLHDSATATRLCRDSATATRLLHDITTATRLLCATAAADRLLHDIVTAAKLLPATATVARLKCVTSVAARLFRATAAAARLLHDWRLLHDIATDVNLFRDTATAKRLLHDTATAARLLYSTATAVRLHQVSATRLRHATAILARLSRVTATTARLLGAHVTRLIGANRTQGDFDIVIIHRRYGFILGEVKSVDKVTDVKKRVKKALEQLNMTEKVLNHLSSDLAPVRVIKTVILPNITSSQLQQVLSRDDLQDLSQDLQACVGGQDLSEAVSRCLCADVLPTTDCLNAIDCGWGRPLLAVRHRLPWLRGRMTKRLTDWWRCCVQEAGQDPRMTKSVYDKLLARFCGPASTIKIPTSTTPRLEVPFRTQGQAVAQTRLRVSQLALVPEQVDVLNNPPSPCVFLHAPPGCGKTIMLALKAIQWLKAGNNVQLVSLSHKSPTVSFLLEAQIEQALGTDAADVGTLTRLSFNFRKDGGGERQQRYISQLKEAQSHDGCVFIIADEVDNLVGENFIQFIRDLHREELTLNLWAAGLVRPDYRTSSASLPPWMSVVPLTTPLRNPPVVLQAVQESSDIDGSKIPCYTSPPGSAHTCGLPIEPIRHRDQPGHCHSGDGTPLSCEKCGKLVASLLKEKFRVGQDVTYRDVVIVCTVRKRLTTDCAMVEELKECGFPVAAVDRYSCDTEKRDLALGTTNRVTVTDSRTFSGLERSIVVGLGEQSVSRLHTVSRSTSQVIIIDQLT